MRVLIAEDEAIIRMDLREMLVEEGHDVVGEARNGAEAVELARELKPDVIFMDVKMPGMDGIEAACILSAEKVAPIVMVTAFSQASYVDQACAAGAMAYLVKPFSKRDIVPAMHVATSRFAETRLLEAEVVDLNDRLETRKVLDRAKGVLMAKGMTEPEAFKRLQRLAMDKRRSLKEIAEAILLASEAEK
ncbi:MAG: response regulator [Actinobacteria bacterium HGW-Actinobacteria-6]|jgi:response regulator NasT|nr:MAG: response regulator [Actinobacteria bacterium HGW-Actinobacteria-6]